MSKSHTIERLDLMPGDLLQIPPPGMRVLRTLRVEFMFQSNGPAAGLSRSAGADPLADLDRSITDLVIRRLYVNANPGVTAVSFVADTATVVSLRVADRGPRTPAPAGPSQTEQSMVQIFGPNAPPVPLGCEMVTRMELTFPTSGQPTARIERAPL